MQRNYTTQDVLRYRDENSCSVFAAKAHFEKQNIMELLVIAQERNDFDLLCDIVEELIKRTNFA
jgi:hypothetical protein